MTGRPTRETLPRRRSVPGPEALTEALSEPDMTDPHALFDDNRKSWDARVPVHVDSEMYDVKGFEAGADPLTPLDLELVGDVAGRRLLHLQCHFGMDTLAWQRRGARATGVDFSGAAIAKARELNRTLGLGATFTECNVLETRQHVEGTFDVVFTSWGVIGWLPDLRPWGETIAACLSPGGRFVINEFHPFVWMSQMGPDLRIREPYFNRGVITEVTEGTYADPSAPLKQREHGWNHSLADVVNALIGAGLRIERMEEVDRVWHACFPEQVKLEDGSYQFKEATGMVPMAFGLVASRPG